MPRSRHGSTLADRSVPLIVTVPTPDVAACVCTCLFCSVPLKVTDPVPDVAACVCTCLLCSEPLKVTDPVPDVAEVPPKLCSLPLTVPEPDPEVAGDPPGSSTSIRRPRPSVKERRCLPAWSVTVVELPE